MPFLTDYYARWKNIFFICFAITALAFCGGIVNICWSADDWSRIFNYCNFAAHGRWITHIFYNHLCQGSIVPVLSPLLAIALLVLAGIEICRFLQVKNKTTAILTILLFATHPYMAEVLIFTDIQIPYTLAFFLAISALNFIDKNKKLAITLIVISLACYQMVLGIMLSLIIIASIQKLISQAKTTAVLRDFLIKCSIIIAAAIIYLIITKIIMMAFSISPDSRMQAGFIDSFDKLIAKLGVVSIILSVRLLPVSEFAIPALPKIIIFAILLSTILTIIIKPKLPQSKKLLCTLLFLIAPLLSFLPLLALASLDMPYRVSIGLVTIISAIFALSCQNQLINTRIIQIFAFILIFSFIFNNNILFFRQYITNQRDIALANRITARLESLPDYRPGLNLQIIGDYREPEYQRVGHYQQIFAEYFRYCRQRNYFLGRGAFQTEWSKYSIFLHYLDLPLKKAPHSHIPASASQRPAWPNEQSVYIENQTAIIILKNPNHN